MKQRIVPLLAAALALTVMLAGCSSQEEAEPLPQGMDTETVLTAGGDKTFGKAFVGKQKYRRNGI